MHIKPKICAKKFYQKLNEYKDDVHGCTSVADGLTFNETKYQNVEFELPWIPGATVSTGKYEYAPNHGRPTWKWEV